MKGILRYIRNYKKEAVLAPTFKMLEAFFELFVPLVMAKIIDVGIKNQDKNYILTQGGVLLLLAIVGFATSITAQFFAAKAAIGFSKELRFDLFKHINSLSYSEIDKVGASTLITRMTSDVNQIQTGVNMALRLFMRSPFVVFGAVIMAFTVDVKTSLIFLIILPLLVIVVFYITFATIPMYRKVQGRLDRVTLLTRENMVGARVIRAFNHEEDEIKAFDTATDELFSAQIGVGRISALMNPVTYVIVNAGIALLIYKGAVQVSVGNLTQGQVVALVNYMSQILIELIKLANLIITTTKAIACGKRVQAIFDTKSSMVFKEDGFDGRVSVDGTGGQNEIHSAGNETPYAEKVPRVAFENVSLCYSGSKENSVEELTFEAFPGDTIGVIGGTGSGKSTLINLIPRFYDATEGSVKIDGVDVKDYTKTGLREKIGIVPQKAVLFKGTVRDNLKWGNESASDEEMLRALETAQAKSFIEEKEGGLDYELSQGAKNLSGGQRQRLTIARALVRNPKILILDDSSSALDFATDAALRKAIKTNTDNMTVFIVSQRASSIRYADKIIVLDDGKAVGIGTHDSLFEDCPVYREICLSQMSGEEAKQ